MGRCFRETKLPAKSDLTRVGLLDPIRGVKYRPLGLVESCQGKRWISLRKCPWPLQKLPGLVSSTTIDSKSETFREGDGEGNGRKRTPGPWDSQPTCEGSDTPDPTRGPPSDCGLKSHTGPRHWEKRESFTVSDRRNR